MSITIAELAGQLGVTTNKLSAACRSLGFNVVDAASEIDVAAFNEAVARKRASLTAPAPVAAEEPYFSLTQVENFTRASVFDDNARAKAAAPLRRRFRSRV